MAAFGDERGHAIDACEQFVAAGNGQPSPWQGLKNQIFLGDEHFVAKMQGEIDRSQPLDEFPASQHRPVPRTIAEYLEETRDRNQAIVAVFASGGYTLQAIGEYFGLHYSRVSRIVSRAKGKT